MNEDRTCAEVPIYVEDTSQFSNPAWVTWVRGWAVVFVVPGIILSFFVLIQGGQLWENWHATGRGLAVLWWLDRKLALNPDDELLWRERSMVTFQLGLNEDAIRALVHAKEARINELRSDGVSFARIAERIKPYDDEIASLQKSIDAEV